MRWLSPIPLRLTLTNESESFRNYPIGVTGLPMGEHPGAYGSIRTHDVHGGVDLYCPTGTPVTAVEEGEIVSVIPFTGEHAGSRWWHDTFAVFVEGNSGVVIYGEIDPSVMVGSMINAGDLVGHVIPVLKRDKGRPMSMLHIELHQSGTREAFEWTVDAGRPVSLRDPTPFLVPLCEK